MRDLCVRKKLFLQYTVRRHVTTIYSYNIQSVGMSLLFINLI